MNATTIDIKDLISNSGMFSYVYGVDLHIARMPTKPDNCIVLYDIAGAMPDLSLSGQRYNREAVQIIIRDQDYSEGMRKAWEIHNYLQGVHNVVINDIHYTLIRSIMTPHQYDWDENNRVLILFSIETQRR